MMDVITWNVQGAASKGFKSVAKNLMEIHNPSMIVLVEPRISGDKAMRVIKALKFDYSHRIEATGFAGGIWVLWKDNYKVRVLLNHPQYVHMLISKNSTDFYSTAVYGSPKPSTRNEL